MLYIFISLERPGAEPPTIPVLSDGGHNYTGHTVEVFVNGIGNMTGLPVFGDFIYYYCLHLNNTDPSDDANSARMWQAPDCANGEETCPFVKRTLDWEGKWQPEEVSRIPCIIFHVELLLSMFHTEELLM